MDLSMFEFTVADQEFYSPLARADVSAQRLAPGRVPAGWQGRTSEIWTLWHRGDRVADAADGWKVHVSARPGRLQEVLDAAAAVCFEQGIAFKHMAAPLFYQWASHKHAARPQAGKFIAAYPADEAASRELMEALREALAGEEGPYILSDRRYRDSRTVHYRYGAYVVRERLQADGRRVLLVRDGTGELVPDERGVSFRLPAGVTDPFAELAAGGPARQAGPVPLGGFVIESAVRHTAAGGTYRAHHAQTGRPVFIKEARPHIGLLGGPGTAPAQEQLRAEWDTLTALHELAPGLAPEPVSYFREWEHEFLAMELVEGIPLARWVSRSHPLVIPGSSAEDFADYYQRCENVLAAVEKDLARLHELGYLFADVSPGNLMIAQDGAVRLVDFGSAGRLDEGFALVAATPGYTPPRNLVGDDPTIFDSYGASALAQHMIAPLHQVVQRNPDMLAHLHADISELAPVPERLWDSVTRYHKPGDSPALPRPEEVAADPVRHLGGLRDAVADALAGLADLDHADRVFPTVVEGYATNTLCVAYGTAGVVHALRHAGRALPEGLAGRLRDDALAGAGSLGPGLYVGLSGVAWVLADLGMLGEAADLLGTARQHPLTARSATLYGGSAGVALACLALHRRTGDEAHLDHALALAAALPADGDLVPLLGRHDAAGLMHGRCGIALMLQQLAAVTGDTALLHRAVGLLHAELDRAADPGAAGLQFPSSAADRRQLPYLYSGSAGIALTAARCLAAADDERLAEALPRLLAPLHGAFTALPALCTGMAGFAFTLADHALLTGSQASSQAAIRAARQLYKYAIPGPDGVRFLGDILSMRYSADLWGGSAGILLALTHVLDPRPGALFTVDEAGGAPARPGAAGRDAG